MCDILIKQIYAYLGYRSVEKSSQTDGMIYECLDELKTLSHFRYVYKFLQTAPDFLKKQPYEDFLKGSCGLILAVMTLGGEVDAKIKFYSRTNAVKAVVLDACASAYLEFLSDSYEKTLGDSLSYRFCPGYGGSDVADVRYIFDIVRPAGITLSPTNYILPSKSMAGVIAVGNSAEKSCKNCTVAEHCDYLKRGVKCYGSEK